MKNLFFLLLILPMAFAARSQAVNKLQADSFRVYQNGGSAEFILENKTRSNTGAFLRNRFNGRTEFAFALDSVWKEGDWLRFTRGQSTLSFNLNALEGTANKLDSLRIRNDSVFYYKNGGTENYAGFVGTDSTVYATRDRINWLLDSLVATLPTPNLQDVTDAGNTTTNTVYAPGFVTSNYKALLYEGGGSGWLDLKDEANNVTVKARGAGTGGRGEVTAEALEFPTNLPAPPNEYNAGSWYVYRRADTLRAFKDGMEYNLIGGGGSGSAASTLSTITYSAAPKFDYAVHGTHAKITLTGNASLGFLNLPAHVEYFTLEVVQDATGGRTLSIPASVQILGGNAGYSLTATGGAVDILTFYWNGSTLYMNYGKDYKY